MKHSLCEFKPQSCQGVLDATLCDKVYQWLATGWRFSWCTLVSSTNKASRHEITEILLKEALYIINHPISMCDIFGSESVLVLFISVLSLMIQISRGGIWDPITRFIIATLWCLYQTKTWISIGICRGLYLSSMVWAER